MGRLCISYIASVNFLISRVYTQGSKKNKLMSNKKKAREREREKEQTHAESHLKQKCNSTLHVFINAFVCRENRIVDSLPVILRLKVLK